MCSRRFVSYTRSRRISWNRSCTWCRLKYISEALKIAIKAAGAEEYAKVIPDNVIGGVNIVQNGKEPWGGKFLGAKGYISVSAGEYNSTECNMFSYTNSKLIYRKDDFDKAFDEAMKHVNHDD